MGFAGGRKLDAVIGYRMGYCFNAIRCCMCVMDEYVVKIIVNEL